MSKTTDKCVDCGEKQRCRDSFTSWIFFLIGIIATISVRVVTILDASQPIYGKIAWYIGVAGFFIFFIYKFMIDSARSRMIRKAGISHKVHSRQELSPEDYNIIADVFCSLSSRKDIINYFFIFTTSIVAFFLALYIDLVK